MAKGNIIHMWGKVYTRESTFPTQKRSKIFILSVPQVWLLDGIVGHFLFQI